MKLAVSGKGGVGKSTLAAALALLLAERGRRVLAVDADPDANLASALGVPADRREQIVPISKQVELIEERTGAKVSQYGQVFKLNPQVSDIAERFALLERGVALLVLGAVKRGGGGCACPESVLLRALVTDLVLYKDEAVVLDMEAGVEHLGRATARGVDLMLAVLEPGRRAVECALRVREMAADVGIGRVRFVGNKIMSSADRDFLQSQLPAETFLGFLPYSESIRRADMDGRAVLDDLDPDVSAELGSILSRIEAEVRA